MVKEKLRNEFTFLPVTKDRWEDFEKLFGRRGACGGCWCMWWRLSRKEYNMQKGDGNKKAMKKIILSETSLWPGAQWRPGKNFHHLNDLGY
jgi:hypothetical protein